MLHSSQTTVNKFFWCVVNCVPFISLCSTCPMCPCALHALCLTCLCTLVPWCFSYPTYLRVLRVTCFTYLKYPTCPRALVIPAPYTLYENYVSLCPACIASSSRFTSHQPMEQGKPVSWENLE